MANQTITISIPEVLVDAMDRRVAGMDCNRSQYLRRLVREDLGISIETEKCESEDQQEGASATAAGGQ